MSEYFSVSQLHGAPLNAETVGGPGKNTLLPPPLSVGLLESAIMNQFIPAITGLAPPGKQIRELLSLSVRLGGLGLRNPIIMAKEQHNASKLIRAPLVDRVIEQDHHLGECHTVQQRIKDTIRSCKR